MVTGKGGRHRYYRQREGDGLRNRTGGRAGMVAGNDIRADGGLVMAPGSVHPETGRVYEFEHGCSPADLPLADADETVAKLALWGGANAHRSQAFTVPGSIGVGERHSAFLGMACSMRAKGYAMEAALAAIRAENAAKCARPLGDAEIVALVGDVWSRYLSRADGAPGPGGDSEDAPDGLESRWRAERVDLRSLPDDVDDLLEGRLSLGGKMIMSAPSKADKSWLAINLAETVAVGGKLLGVKARNGRVLYLNLEVRRAKFYRRLLTVAEARG